MTDLTGKKFGLWTVVGYSDKTIKGQHRWKCRCSCGTMHNVQHGNLVRSLSTSCGCTNKGGTTHGLYGTREWISWQNMKRRCLNKKNKHYRHYGGRGITICKEWMESFYCFYADMGPCPPGFTIERKENNGNYCPSNCIWSDRKTQCNNTRRNSFVTCNSESKTVAEWSALTGISYGTLYQRLFVYGWDVETALTRPIDNRTWNKRRKPWPPSEPTTSTYPASSIGG